LAAEIFVCNFPTKEDLPMATLSSVSVRVSAQERQLLEAAAEQFRTNLSDFLGRKAVETAEIELGLRNLVVIPAAAREAFEAWVDSPAQDVPALGKLSKAIPAWHD
jgi:uncharacterized protein (DUF1778 family)